ncbi:hypothetical protein KHP62_18325 [Rhodobacteraceae bacterium NNCM2]|nr:hypothetical protein [Coraliihabitans acroporae]
MVEETPIAGRMAAMAPAVALTTNLIILFQATDSVLILDIARWYMRFLMTGGSVFLVTQLLSGRGPEVRPHILALLVWVALAAVLSWSFAGAALIVGLVAVKTLMLAGWVWSRLSFGGLAPPS